LFTTVKGWRDPFSLLAAEDPDGRVASVLAQAAISPRYSGAALVGAENQLIIEGRPGEGDVLMLGKALPEPLPPDIIADVKAIHAHLSHELGPIRMEWVHDGAAVWIVQLHVGPTDTSTTVIVPGEADHWLNFDAIAGLGALRELLAQAGPNVGIEVSGRIGLTSHIADVLRRSRRPSRMHVKSA
jgi:hypothetical protein